MLCRFRLANMPPEGQHEPFLAEPHADGPVECDTASAATTASDITHFYVQRKGWQDIAVSGLHAVNTTGGLADMEMTGAMRASVTVTKLQEYVQQPASQCVAMLKGTADYATVARAQTDLPQSLS